MEPILSTAASSLAETGGSSLVTYLIERFRSSRSDSRRLAAHIDRLYNRVTNLVTYRTRPQHIEEVFVPPRMLDAALVRREVKPAIYAELYEQLVAKHPGEDIAVDLQDRLQGAFSASEVSFQELATGCTGLVCLGEAGSGKSTTLYYLCYRRMTSPNPRLPVLIDSRELAGEGLRRQFDRYLQELAVADREVGWIDGNLALYVDGLDEIPASRYKEACADLALLRSQYPSMHIAVTCRGAAYGGELGYLREVSILPFDYDRGVEFISKWFGSAGAEAGESLIRHLNGSERLKELATHPLLLALMCNAHRRYQNISRRQTALFEQCVNALLWEWDADRQVTRGTDFGDLDLEKKRWLHAVLAVRLHEGRTRYFERHQILQILESELPSFGVDRREADAVLRELASNHGIMWKFTEDTWGFGHLALQEYLTGRWYADEKRWVRLVTPATIADPWWQNALALAIASLSNATSAFQYVHTRSDVAELDKLGLMSHALRYDPIVDAGFRQKILNRVLYLVHNGNAAEHDRALDMLIGIDDAWTAPLIRKSLAGKLPTKTMAQTLFRSPQFRNRTEARAE